MNNINNHTQENISAITESFKKFLLEKNKKYGDSALEPLDIFDNVISKEPDTAIKGILIRILDKLKRIKNSDVLRKNDVADIIGYFTLICVKKDWTNFDDLID